MTDGAEERPWRGSDPEDCCLGPRREAQYGALLREGYARFDIPRYALVGFVSVPEQKLSLFAWGGWIEDLTVSTAAAGVNAREGSGGTPPGWHRMCAHIGENEPPGRVFVSREPTDEVVDSDGWRNGPGDRILTRVFWLQGLEPGVNAGPGIDSKERYIYLHGTNAEDRLGTPCSHGCIRLGNFDAIRLSILVAEQSHLFYVHV